MLEKFLGLAAPFPKNSKKGQLCAKVHINELKDFRVSHLVINLY